MADDDKKKKKGKKTSKKLVKTNKDDMIIAMYMGRNDAGKHVYAHIVYNWQKSWSQAEKIWLTEE